MKTVQATIHFLTDYHSHNRGTEKLALLTPTQRQAFLVECLERLHGSRIDAFEATIASPEFRPVLTFVTGTFHPSIQSIHDAIQRAIERYNAGDFPLQFSTEIGNHPHGAEPTRRAMAAHFRPPDCVQAYIGPNGETLYKYNWDGHVLNEAAPKAGDLTGSYRLALVYPASPSPA